MRENISPEERRPSLRFLRSPRAADALLHAAKNADFENSGSDRIFLLRGDHNTGESDFPALRQTKRRGSLSETRAFSF